MNRYDGKLIKKATDLQTAMIHLMPNRADAEVYFQEKLDVSELLIYCENNKNINLFSALITALAKMFVLRPKFNRFVQGQKLYERNEITFSFVCKTEFNDDAPEALITLKIDPNDNVDAISQKIFAEITKKRSGEITGSDYSVNALAKIPHFLRVIIFKILRLLDYCGVNLSKLTSSDPNYSSCLVSNLGSINLPVMYHHLNNYGTNSCVVTIGKLHKEEIIDKDGNKRICDIVEIGATVDERIADGFYFSKSVEILRNAAKNPEVLFEPLDSKI